MPPDQGSATPRPSGLCPVQLTTGLEPADHELHCSPNRQQHSSPWSAPQQARHRERQEGAPGSTLSRTRVGAQGWVLAVHPTVPAVTSRQSGQAFEFLGFVSHICRGSVLPFGPGCRYALCVYLTPPHAQQAWCPHAMGVSQARTTY